MIVASMTGNLGNHMWNYVNCRIVAEKLGYEWGVCPTPTHDYLNGESQMYFMDVDFGKEVKVIGQNSRTLNIYENIPNEYYDIPKHIYHDGQNVCINMYDPNVFNIKDNTMVHLIAQSEDYLIDRKNDIINWFKIKEEYINKYEIKLKELNIKLDNNTCVINFRGGEYVGVPNLICEKNYWQNSINYIKKVNSNINFIIITDDESVAKEYIGDYPCYHIEIGFDFYCINQSKYLILSNSSFGWWAAWLNQKHNLIIAPKYWARHNISDGYWALGDQYTRCFNYMDRVGNLLNYEQCKKEALEYYLNNNLLN
jgi:hypothetical protein